MTRRYFRPAFALLAAASLLGCAGNKREVEAPVRQETPADEIRRVSNEWVYTAPTQGLLSPPSPISVFHTITRSVVTFRGEEAHEELTIWEDLELRSGGTVRCANKFSHPLKVRWGRKNGEPAVEISRPALEGKRTCDGIHPEANFAEPARVARFVLRSDRLVAVEPATDGRTYLPES